MTMWSMFLHFISIALLRSFCQLVAVINPLYDGFIRLGIVQYDGNPCLVVHVVGGIDAGQLVEGVAVLRWYLQVDDVDERGIAVFVEHGALHAHDQGEPLAVGCMAECPIGLVARFSLPREVRLDLKALEDALRQAVGLVGREQHS